ncbi:hypothetical protein MLD38_015943 [Melastoma candidum]|uniref:Uncharacterized protein n=1 Tax=Melastoma candidum TaxID=119954 RepID=A0ACB9RH21_9MYRT|nr:hypothetical protein MLD38_015943 [Melastoma candidum]
MPATSAKLVALLHTLISSQICRAVRALSRAKSFIVEVLKKGHHPVRLVYCRRWHGGRNGCGHAYLGSFRFHYNWRSSRSFSIPGSVLDGLRPSFLPCESKAGRVSEEEEDGEEEDGSAGLSGYLRWLEERKPEGEETSGEGCAGGSDIDELADVFIAKCHEKFILEKQESDRRFQEMLARSV